MSLSSHRAALIASPSHQATPPLLPPTWGTEAFLGAYKPIVAQISRSSRPRSE